MPTQSACELAQVYYRLAWFERLHVEVVVTDCQQELKIWYRSHRVKTGLPFFTSNSSAYGCRLDKPKLCAKPSTFSSIVDKLQLSQAQRAEMLRLRKVWRGYLAGYAS